MPSRTVSNQKITITCIFFLGLVFPFIDYLVIIQAFFLFIPLVILLCISIGALIGYLIWDRRKLESRINLIMATPAFILAQLVSTSAVDKIQRLRSESIIKDIENVKVQTGEAPAYCLENNGINFSRMDNKKDFKISYSRGFMVTETYSSRERIWKSESWND